MNDNQLKTLLGVDETFQMLEFRETVKSQMSPEEYEQNMQVYKATIQVILDQVPAMSPLDAGEFIVDQLDSDLSLNDDQREIWKALVVIAAFEMQEF